MCVKMQAEHRPIQALPEEVVSKIRSSLTTPSLPHCIEELVLNSLDANATCIAVRVDLESLKVQVVDNGCGLVREDLELVGQRYATSKCYGPKDLGNLAFFGSTGEFLASLSRISSVLEVISRPQNEEETSTKLFRKGKTHAICEAKEARPVHGTTVTAYNVYYNLPVRQKNINVAITLERIRRSLEALAIVHHQVSFSLRDDCTGSKILQTHSTKSMKGAFGFLSGHAKSNILRDVHHAHKTFTVRGYVGVECHANKSLQFVFVNKRPVHKTKIHKIVNKYLSRSLLSKSQKYDQEPPFQKDFLSLCNQTSPKRIQGEHTVYILEIGCLRSEYDILPDPSHTFLEFQDWTGVSVCIEKALQKFLVKENLVLNVSETVEGTEEGSKELFSDSDDDELIEPVKSPSPVSPSNLRKLHRFGYNINTTNLPNNLQSRVVTRAHLTPGLPDHTDECSRGKSDSGELDGSQVGMSDVEGGAGSGMLNQSDNGSPNFDEPNQTSKRFGAADPLLPSPEEACKNTSQREEYHKPGTLIDCKVGGLSSEESELGQHGDQTNKMSSGGAKEGEQSAGIQAQDNQVIAQQTSEHDQSRVDFSTFGVRDSEESETLIPELEVPSVTSGEVSSGRYKSISGMIPSCASTISLETRASRLKASGCHETVGNGERDGALSMMEANDTDSPSIVPSQGLRKRTPIKTGPGEHQFGGQTSSSSEQLIGTGNIDAISPRSPRKSPRVGIAADSDGTNKSLKHARMNQSEKDHIGSSERQTHMSSLQKFKNGLKCGPIYGAGKEPAPFSHFKTPSHPDKLQPMNKHPVKTSVLSELRSSSELRSQWFPDVGQRMEDGREKSLLSPHHGKMLSCLSQKLAHLRACRGRQGGHASASTADAGARLDGELEVASGGERRGEQKDGLSVRETSVGCQTSPLPDDETAVDHQNKLHVLWSRNENRHPELKDHQGNRNVTTEGSGMKLVSDAATKMGAVDEPPLNGGAIHLPGPMRAERGFPQREQFSTSDVDGILVRRLTKYGGECPHAARQRPLPCAPGAERVCPTDSAKPSPLIANMERIHVPELSRYRRALPYHLEDECPVIKKRYDNVFLSTGSFIQTAKDLLPQNDHSAPARGGPILASRSDHSSAMQNGRVVHNHDLLEHSRCLRNAGERNNLVLENGVEHDEAISDAQQNVDWRRRRNCNKSTIQRMGQGSTGLSEITRPSTVPDENLGEETEGYRGTTSSGPPSVNGESISDQRHQELLSLIDSSFHPMEADFVRTSGQQMSVHDKVPFSGYEDEDVNEFLSTQCFVPQQIVRGAVHRSVEYAPSPQYSRDTSIPDSQPFQVTQNVAGIPGQKSSSGSNNKSHHTNCMPTKVPTNGQHAASAVDGEDTARKREQRQKSSGGSNNKSHHTNCMPTKVPTNGQHAASAVDGEDTARKLEQRLCGRTDTSVSDEDSTRPISRQSCEGVLRSDTAGVNIATCSNERMLVMVEPATELDVDESHGREEKECAVFEGCSSQIEPEGPPRKEVPAPMSGHLSQGTLDDLAMISGTDDETEHESLTVTESPKKQLPTTGSAVGSSQLSQETRNVLQSMSEAELGELTIIKASPPDVGMVRGSQEEVEESHKPDEVEGLSTVQNDSRGLRCGLNCTDEQLRESVCDSLGKDGDVRDTTTRTEVKLAKDHTISLQRVADDNENQARTDQGGQDVGPAVKKNPVSRGARGCDHKTVTFQEPLEARSPEGSNTREPSTAGRITRKRAASKPLPWELFWFLPKSAKDFFPCKSRETGERQTGADGQEELHGSALRGTAKLIKQHLTDADREALGIKWKEGLPADVVGPSKSVDDLFNNWRNPIFETSGREVLNATQALSATVEVHNSIHLYHFTKDIFKSIQVIGQLDNKFLACLIDTPTGARVVEDGPPHLLVLVDQHAAHERIRLEQLTQEAYTSSTSQQADSSSGEGSQESCPLRSTPVLPVPIHISNHECRIAQAYSDKLGRFGIAVDIRRRGKATKAEVTALPTCLVEPERSFGKKAKQSCSSDLAEALVQECVHLLQETSGSCGVLPKTITRALNSQACRGAIKFGDPLCYNDMVLLLSQLSECDLPFQCAHGRPSMIPLLDLNHLYEKLHPKCAHGRPSIIPLLDLNHLYEKLHPKDTGEESDLPKLSRLRKMIDAGPLEP